MREIRRRLRELPRERRKDVTAAVRGGRAVQDPRDAALAVAWAEALDARRQSWIWPRWVLPRTRPTGWHAWLWLVHVFWIAALVVVTDARLLRPLSETWRWIIVAGLVYSVTTGAFTTWWTLQSYWNAGAAARANREVMPRP